MHGTANAVFAGSIPAGVSMNILDEKTINEFREACIQFYKHRTGIHCAHARVQVYKTLRDLHGVEKVLEHVGEIADRLREIEEECK